MSWLYEKKTYDSAKNGPVTCKRFFGRWEVFVGEYHESSRYLVSVWRDAYRHLPADFRPKNVLMFGLAGGDNIRLMHERFPGCRVTAVEWDPVMVRIADEIRLFPPEHRPNVVIADARDAVTTLKGNFDFILIDIFRGKRVAESAFSDVFLHGIRRLLAPDGLVIANGFRQPELFTALDRHLTPVARWRKGYNLLASFRKPLAEDAAKAVR